MPEGQKCTAGIYSGWQEIAKSHVPFDLVSLSFELLHRQCALCYTPKHIQNKNGYDI